MNADQLWESFAIEAEEEAKNGVEKHVMQADCSPGRPKSERPFCRQARPNLSPLETASWPLFRAGHLPMIGEWVALPVLDSAGATGPTGPVAEQVLYPTAARLLQRCDVVLRLPGVSRGADQEVAIAHERGIPVYYALADVPEVS